MFADPRLAAVYDALNPDRRDLDLYVELLQELGARTVLDVGCGTGTFAIFLAQRGFHVTAVDPALASLDVARAKPGTEGINWLLGDATTRINESVDAVTMTGNVAQVFLDDSEWIAALLAAYENLDPGGHLIFETRVPSARAWDDWTHAQTYREAVIDGEAVACWEEVSSVTPATVSFRTTFKFSRADAVATSTSTLRFRDQGEVIRSLRAAGFGEPAVLDAPDRPGLEFVFVSRRA